MIKDKWEGFILGIPVGMIVSATIHLLVYDANSNNTDFKSKCQDYILRQLNLK